MERLQKIIAQAGICSRREAEKLILAGKVSVDGKIIRELGAKASTNQKIRVDGKLLTFDTEKIYLLLNKPRGYVSTVKDERGRRTVLELLGENFSDKRVYPVGRLDLNSEGLIILTNDGDLTNALIHPRYEVTKTYRAKISGLLTEEKLDKLVTKDGLNEEAATELLGKSPIVEPNARKRRRKK